MSLIRRTVRAAAIAGVAASLSSCVPDISWLYLMVGAAPVPIAGPTPKAITGARTAQLQGGAQLGGCDAQFTNSTTANVTCTLGWSGGGGYSGMATMTFRNLPAGTSLGSVHGGVVIQMPASVTNLRGTYSGSASGSLNVVRSPGTVPVDNASSIVPEPGMALWVIESPPNPGFYQFALNFDESGAAPLPLRAKFMLVERVVANGRTYYPPMFPCTTSFAEIPAPNLPDGATALPIDFSPLLAQRGCSGKTYDFGPIVQVVEYYNASLDHYFITWVGSEIALLDAGTTIKGWQRTNKSFKAYVTAQANTTDVCRIYIIPDRGDSHFFGRGATECNDTMAAHPDFVLEDARFMAMILPAAGVCPAGTVKVYRVFSNRPDANHRYLTDLGTRAQMVAQGWVVEGDGPDAVVMCGPA